MSDERLTALYRAYGPLIYARCRRMLGDEALAEDATQETFVRAYRHLDKARDVNEALPWIYRIATHYCLNALRDRQRRAEPMAELPERPGAHAEETLSNREFVSRLLSRTPDKVRDVAWLYHVEGLDQTEVAHMLGISRRTVVNRLASFDALAARFRAGGARSP